MKTIFYNLDMSPGSSACHCGDDGRCTDGASHDSLPPRAATIGFFDGVHRGHQFLIEQLKDAAAERGLQTMAITFDRHPREVVRVADSGGMKHLTTLEEKCSLLAATGIDMLVVLHFDKQMAALSAEQFMERVLARDLGVRLLVTGYDNRFGHDRTEGFSDYCRYGERIGMDVVCGEPLCLPASTASPDGSVTASSSVVRRLIAEGRVEQAATLLGYRYTVGGSVVHGEQRGRQMGFPTANLQPDSPQKLIPKAGVYAVIVRTEDGQAMPGMTNIGMRPTFHGSSQTIETHIMTGEMDAASIDLYNQRLELQFVARLRDEQPFDSPESLSRQLQQDKRQALQLTAALCETTATHHSLFTSNKNSLT